MFFVLFFETFTANSTKSCLVRRPKYAKLKIIFFLQLSLNLCCYPDSLGRTPSALPEQSQEQRLACHPADRQIENLVISDTYFPPKKNSARNYDGKTI